MFSARQEKKRANMRDCVTINSKLPTIPEYQLKSYFQLSLGTSPRKSDHRAASKGCYIDPGLQSL